MKTKTVFVLLLLGFGNGLLNLDEAFMLFTQKHKKVYSSPEERDLRKRYFIESYELVKKANQGSNDEFYNMVLLGSGPKDFASKIKKKVSQFTTNYFSDKSPEERKRYFTPSFLFRNPKMRFARYREEETPNKPVSRLKKIFSLRKRSLQLNPSLKKKVDWTHLAKPAKSQDKCQACYVFSTNSLVESWYQKLTSQSIELSVQEIVSCSVETYGCAYGLPFKVMDYIIVNGITYSQFYPFEGNVTKACQVQMTIAYLDMVKENNLANETQAEPPKHARRLQSAAERLGSFEFSSLSSADSKDTRSSVQSFKNRKLSASNAQDSVDLKSQNNLSANQNASAKDLKTQSRPSPQEEPADHVKERRLNRSSFDPLFGPGRTSFSPSQPFDFSEYIKKKRLETMPRFHQLIGYEPVKPGIINLLKRLQEGPVAVLIHAPEALMFLDKGVIYDGEGCTDDMEPSHAIVIYAYNLEAPVPYFYFKNSWSDVWADDGFGKMQIGPIKEYETGLCGIAATSQNFTPLFKSIM